MPAFGSEPPLIFVWAGNELPRYAEYSIRLASIRYSGEIILLSEQQPTNLPSRWFDVGNFVNPLWEEFRGTFTMDPHFRGGLWLHAYERFFILEEFCRREGIQRAFHAELDTLVLDLDDFSTTLDTYGDAIFVPAVDPGSVVASLVYWNSPEALRSLCDYFTAEGGKRTEMNALSDFLHKDGTKALSFATEQVWDTAHWPYGSSAVSVDTGIIDGKGFGMWLFGQGPRTTRCTIWSKHRPRSAKSFPIDCLRFRVGSSGKNLTVRGPGGEARKIRTLHVSSKIHRALASPTVFRFLVWASRLTVRLPLIPRWHCLQKRFLKALIWALRRHSGRIGTVATGALGRALVGYSNRRGIDLSKNQRQVLGEMATHPKLTGRSLSLTHVLVVSEAEAVTLATPPPLKATANIENNQLILIRPPRGGASDQWSAPDLLKEGVAQFGFDPEIDGGALLADVDLWPVLLSRVLNTEGIFFSDGASSTAFPAPMLTNREQIQVLGTEKHISSIQQVQSLLGISGYAPSWSYNARQQLYRRSHLETLFPDRKALLTWWNEGRHGQHESALADYYGAWLLREKVVRQQFTFASVEQREVQKD